MSESFRPHESASIDAGLRTRLEGTIELLEDALPLLDSLMYLLARVEASRDDIATLQECVTQLPHIDGAIDKANRHEQAIALTQAVGMRKQLAHHAANERLIALGHGEVPSLRGSVTAVLDLLRRQGTPPGPTEQRLAQSGGPPWALALFVSATQVFALVGFGWPKLGALWGAIVCIGCLYARTPKPWVLLPDRLYFPARWPRLSRELVPSSIKGLELDGRQVVARAGEVVKLEAEKPQELVTMLRLLGGVWLSGLKSPARPFVVVDAIEDSSKGVGRALISTEGVLFVSKDRLALMTRALTAEKLPTEPSLDLLLMLIAHLPEGRWAAMGEHLAKSADAIWISRDDLELEEHVVNRRVRLMLTRDPRRIEAEALLARLG